MSLISIIIPVYNVEEYIEKCLGSVLNQTYRNLEIILVNDGSTDNSMDLVEGIITDDSRVHTINQPNAGLSAARNAGLKHANGEFIFYLDSDDFIKLDCIEKLYNLLVEHQADLVQANFYYDYKTYLLFNNTLHGKNKVFSGKEAMELLFHQEIIKNFAWGKLIKSDIAKKYPFPHGKSFEDTFWKYRIIHHTKKYVVAAEPLLYYLQRSSGISGSFSPKHIDQVEGDSLRLDFIKENYPDFYNTSLKLFNNKIIRFKELAKSLPENQRNLLNEQLEHYIEKYNLESRFSLKYAIYSNPLLGKSFNLYKRLSQRFFSKNNWIKISK